VEAATMMKKTTKKEEMKTTTMKKKWRWSWWKMTEVGWRRWEPFSPGPPPCWWSGPRSGSSPRARTHAGRSVGGALPRRPSFIAYFSYFRWYTTKFIITRFVFIFKLFFFRF
jgi:hypothetical protein